MGIQWVTHRIPLKPLWNSMGPHGFLFMGYVAHHGFHGYPMGIHGYPMCLHGYPINPNC